MVISEVKPANAQVTTLMPVLTTTVVHRIVKIMQALDLHMMQPVMPLFLLIYTQVGH